MNSLFTFFSRALASLLLGCIALISPAQAQDFAPLEKFVHATRVTTVSYQDENGHTQTLDFKKNKLTALHFWATWCHPCAGELPHVDAAQKAYGNKGFSVVAISLDNAENKEKVKPFLTANHIVNLTPYFDPQMDLFKELRGDGLPTTIFIDSQGNELAYGDGPLDWDSQPVTDLINSHLK